MGGAASKNVKKGKVAVQEEEDTYTNLQMSGDLDHLDESRITKEGQNILHDFVESCGILNTEEKLLAVRTKYKELLATHSVPIRFIKFSDFVGHGSIPKFPEADFTCNLSNINREECLMIFVSRPDSDYVVDYEKDTFRLCVNGIRKLWSKYAPSVKECYLWIDYSCIEQDKVAREPPPLAAIKHCDVIFTPIPDGNDKWNYGSSEDSLENYQSKAWKDGSTAYLSTGRCRLEMLGGASLPTIGNENAERHEQFTLELAFQCKVGRRLHLLYGTKEDNVDGQPFALDAFNKQSFLETYNPEEGNCHSEDERDAITMIMDDLRLHIHEEGYFGERNKQGQYHGRGVLRSANGDCYRGEFSKGLKEGHGVLVTTHWVYEGQWRADKMMDTACMITQSNGTVYEGEVRDGVWHGEGFVSLSNGDTYEGAFEEGCMCGHGTYRHSNGDVYEGEFKQDFRDGTGTFTFASGKVYQGEFRDGSFVHGAVRMTNGDVYEGSLENDQFHGTGKIHLVASGEVYEGEFHQNEISGKGIYVYPSTHGKFDIYEGTFEKGKRSGVGTLTKADGSVEKGLWMKDNLVKDLGNNRE